MAIKIEISSGEFVDRLSILEIKNERTQDPTRLENINRELCLLRDLWVADPGAAIDIQTEWAQMKSINEKLWDIEDDIRNRERTRCFDEEFIRLARAVYYTNDERVEVKRRLNEKLGSALVEEKSYADYQPSTISRRQSGRVAG